MNQIGKLFGQVLSNSNKDTRSNLFNTARKLFSGASTFDGVKRSKQDKIEILDVLEKTFNLKDNQNAKDLPDLLKYKENLEKLLEHLESCHPIINDCESETHNIRYSDRKIPLHQLETIPLSQLRGNLKNNTIHLFAELLPDIDNQTISKLAVSFLSLLDHRIGFFRTEYTTEGGNFRTLLKDKIEQVEALIINELKPKDSITSNADFRVSIADLLPGDAHVEAGDPASVSDLLLIDAEIGVNALEDKKLSVKDAFENFAKQLERFTGIQQDIKDATLYEVIRDFGSHQFACMVENGVSKITDSDKLNLREKAIYSANRTYFGNIALGDNTMTKDDIKTISEDKISNFNDKCGGAFDTALSAINVLKKALKYDGAIIKKCNDKSWISNSGDYEYEPDFLDAFDNYIKECKKNQVDPLENFKNTFDNVDDEVEQYNTDVDKFEECSLGRLKKIGDDKIYGIQGYYNTNLAVTLREFCKGNLQLAYLCKSVDDIEVPCNISIQELKEMEARFNDPKAVDEQVRCTLENLKETDITYKSLTDRQKHIYLMHKAGEIRRNRINHNKNYWLDFKNRLQNRNNYFVSNLSPEEFLASTKVFQNGVYRVGDDCYQVIGGERKLLTVHTYLKSGLSDLDNIKNGVFDNVRFSGLFSNYVSISFTGAFNAFTQLRQKLQFKGVILDQDGRFSDEFIECFNASHFALNEQQLAELVKKQNVGDITGKERILLIDALLSKAERIGTLTIEEHLVLLKAYAEGFQVDKYGERYRGYLQACFEKGYGSAQNVHTIQKEDLVSLHTAIRDFCSFFTLKIITEGVKNAGKLVNSDEIDEKELNLMLKYSYSVDHIVSNLKDLLIEQITNSLGVVNIDEKNLNAFLDKYKPLFELSSIMKKFNEADTFITKDKYVAWLNKVTAEFCDYILSECSNLSGQDNTQINRMIVMGILGKVSSLMIMLYDFTFRYRKGEFNDTFTAINQMLDEFNYKDSVIQNGEFTNGFLKSFAIYSIQQLESKKTDSEESKEEILDGKKQPKEEPLNLNRSGTCSTDEFDSSSAIDLS